MHVRDCVSYEESCLIHAKERKKKEKRQANTGSAQFAMPSPSRSNHLRKKHNLTRPSTSDRQHDKRARKQHFNSITRQGRPLTMDFFNFRSATGFVSTRPFPPSPAARLKPMPSDHRERWAGSLVRNTGYPAGRRGLRTVRKTMLPSRGA